MSPEKLPVTPLTNVDPKQLVFDAANRPVDRKHVNRFKLAMALENKLHISPIIISQNKTIIDGQHRVQAAMELDFTVVPCLVVSAVIDDATEINQNMKNWNSRDFAHFWAKKGKKDYQIFLAFVRESGMADTTAINLLTGKPKGGGGHHLRNFRKGQFRIHESKGGDWLRYVERFLARLEDIRPHYNRATKERAFILAFWNAYTHPLYDHDRMIKKIRVLGLSRRATTQDQLDQLTHVYNYRVREADKVFFGRE